MCPNKAVVHQFKKREASVKQATKAAELECRHAAQYGLGLREARAQQV
jgi:hypothetical protein